jgi:hypothetical protein
MALGYSKSENALATHVDDEDKGVTKRDTLGGTQKMFITEKSGRFSGKVGTVLVIHFGKTIGARLRDEPQ